MIIKEPKNILVAGDPVLFRTKLSKVLSEVGHKVWIGRSGWEVMGKIKETSGELDLLILDMQNININGYKVLEWLNGDLAVKPLILAITGAYDISHNLEHLKQLGVNGVITKGFSPERIVFRVNKLLFSKKLRDREEPRVPVSIPLDFSIGDESYTSFLLNISASGFFLYTKEALLPGTLLQVKFVLPGAERVMDLKGIVRWSTKPGVGKNYFNGAGVLFTSISYEDKKTIRRFVHEELHKVDPETPLSD
jgi:uncharacterized protein (TIGR02266 family)